MMRSMFSAISGLRNHQVFLDVIGNNLANVNTTAFKASRVSFQDMLSQTLRGASSATTGRGGVNAAQVGLGMLLGGIDTVQTQGNLQSTGKQTDLAIQGDGYFVLGNGTQRYYSRDGAFDLATDGTLVNPSTGYQVLGWAASAASTIDTSGAPASLTVPIGQGVIGQVSAITTMGGNVDRDATAAVSTTIATYDATGGQHKVALDFTKTAGNTWEWTAATADTDGTVVSYNADTDTAAERTITFDGTTGKVTSPTAGLTINIAPPALSGAAAYDLSIDFTQMTQLASPNEITSSSDGAPAGSLMSFSIGNSGVLSGIYSNGLNQQLGQIAVATFPNPGGLLRTGSNLLTVSANSGTAQIGAPASSGRGELASGVLEMSNVDLALQFTNMIIAQRGFQANSRVITATDEMLQDLVNLKR